MSFYHMRHSGGPSLSGIFFQKGRVNSYTKKCHFWKNMGSGKSESCRLCLPLVTNTGRVEYHTLLLEVGTHLNVLTHVLWGPLDHLANMSQNVDPTLLIFQESGVQPVFLSVEYHWKFPESSRPSCCKLLWNSSRDYHCFRSCRNAGNER